MFFLSVALGPVQQFPLTPSPEIAVRLDRLLRPLQHAFDLQHTEPAERRGTVAVMLCGCFTTMSATVYTALITPTAVPVTIAAEHSRIGGGLEHLNYTLTRTGDTTAPLSVTVNLTPNPNPWLTDANLSHTVEFAANEATKNLRINDSRFSFDPETEGTVTATVSGTGVDGDSVDVTVVSIADPPITVAFDKNAYSFPEGGPEDDVDIYVTATVNAAFPRAPTR